MPETSETVHLNPDDLPKDLSQLWDEVFEDQRITQLATRKLLYMEKLVLYIVNRDHKVLDHGIKLGKESK